MKRVKKQTLKRKSNDGRSYNFDNERTNFREVNYIYDEVTELEEARIFQDGLDDIESIEHEIRCRVKITKYEIFKIGELLTMGKKVCHEQEMSFKDWINHSFDFSYETANNYMNVFKYCIGQREIALKIPPSILYKISKPSFPDALRNYLFDKGNINELTNGNLSNILAKYKEGGIESIEPDLLELNRSVYVFNQTQNTFDMCTNTLHTMEELKEKIINQGIKSKRSTYDYIGQTQSHEPEAAKINEALFVAIEDCIKMLDNTLDESRKSLAEYAEKASSKM